MTADLATAVLERKIDSLTTAFVAMARTTGARLTRADMCARLDVCSKTLTDRVRKGDVPAPLKGEGKWLFATVFEWEISALGKAPPADRLDEVIEIAVRTPGHHLYRHFDEAGRLLYVGISLHAIGRLAQHKIKSPWVWSIARVEVESLPSLEAAIVAEKTAIRSEHPIFNGIHGSRSRRATGLKLLSRSQKNV